MTSSLVHASKTAWAGALKVRSMRSVVSAVLIRRVSGGRGVGAATSKHGPGGARCRRRPRRGGPPRPAARRCGRSRRLLVLVVQAPPLVGLGLRVALGRVLPLLLAAERGDVEVAPRAAHRLVAATVHEVGPEDPVAVADERVGAVPLADAEVRVPV